MLFRSVVFILFFCLNYITTHPKKKQNVVSIQPNLAYVKTDSTHFNITIKKEQPRIFIEEKSFALGMNISIEILSLIISGISIYFLTSIIRSFATTTNESDLIYLYILILIFIVVLSSFIIAILELITIINKIKQNILHEIKNTALQLTEQQITNQQNEPSKQENEKN